MRKHRTAATRLALWLWIAFAAVLACGGPAPDASHERSTAFLPTGTNGFGGKFFPRWPPFNGRLIDAGVAIDAPSTTTMSLALTDSADPTAAGNGFSYATTLTNTGSTAATTVSCAITLDASLTPQSASGSGWTCNLASNVYTCTRASAAVGAQPAITVNVTAGNAAVAATTTAACSASNATTANASQGTTVSRPLLVASLTDSADPVITGADSYSYTFGLSNGGVGGAGSVNTISAAITLDSSLTYVSASGTGWTCGFSAPTVTCTLPTLGVGSANNVTINVTTGTSGVSASSSVTVTASNASNATASQGTTVDLVNKDAVAGLYLPESTTQWNKFIARKGLSITAPAAIWLMQDASGNAVDATGNGFDLTAAGTGIAYQQTVTGMSRKSIVFADNGTAQLKSTSASLPNISTTSMRTLVVAKITGPGSTTRNFMVQGTTTRSAINITLTPLMRAASGATTVDGTLNPTGSFRPFTLYTSRLAGQTGTFAYNDIEKLNPTFNSGVTGQAVVFGDNTATTIGVSMSYAVEWHGTGAEVSEANYKATLQAMGFTITGF